MPIETDLAEAARKLLADLSANHRPGGGGATKHERALQAALDVFRAQQRLRIDFSASRLPDEKLKEIFGEELFRCGFGAPYIDFLFNHRAVSDHTPANTARAGLAAMRRIADYADHLRGLIVQLAANADLEALIYTVRDQELQGWDGPKVKAAGEAIAGMLAEANVGPKQKWEGALKAGIEAAKNCASIGEPRQALAEAACDQPYTIKDGKPFCDTCGLFRASLKS
jgi:hypothetical protein